MKKIGIVGGTFDPIHRTHLLLGIQAYEEYDLDEIWLIPAGDPYFKTEDRDNGRRITAGSHRLKMCRLAVSKDMRFRVLDLELNKKGRTYTAETLRDLHDAYPEACFYFCMGADSLLSFEKWYHTEEILSLATLLVALRPDADCEAHKETQGVALNELQIYAERICRQYGGAIHFLHMKESNLSSTDIRRQLSDREWTDPEGSLPEGVLSYIRAEKLYENKENG